MTLLKNSPLKPSEGTISQYDPTLLYPIPRAQAREMIGGVAPFQGWDLWQAFEFSWLLPTGMPQVGILRFLFDAMSPNLIESKSFKLYLNSFNNTQMTLAEVHHRLKADLSQAAQSPVQILLSDKEEIVELEGTCLDTLKLDIDCYERNPALLKVGTQTIRETLTTHLFKSNCLVTGQPDWASLQISYHGPALDHAGLLRYLISYRNHAGLHEQCIEQIFTDIKKLGAHQLTVFGRFTRRGGLDINPLRSTERQMPPLGRLARQ